MIISVSLAVFSVLGGVLPYLAVSGIILDFIENRASVTKILLWSTLYFAGALIKESLYAKSTILSHKAAFVILKSIREAITIKLRKVPLGFSLSKPSGKLKMLIVDEVEKLEYPLAHAIPEVTSNLLAPAVIFSLMLFIDFKMALVSLMTLPVGFLIILVMMAGYQKRHRVWFKSGENVNSAIVEFINGIEVVKAFNQTTSSFEKYRLAVIDYRDRTLDWYKANWPYSAAYSAIFPAVHIFTLPIGMSLYMEGSLSLSSFIFVLILSLGLIPPIMKLVEFSDNLAVIAQTEAKVSEILNVKEMVYAEQPVDLTRLDIELNDVCFAYDEKPVLKNISCLIKENTTTALVGPSGSGKSTIIRLIARHWDVTTGRITVGGHDLKHVPQNQLSSLISSVSQHVHLFDMSIRDNIRIGNPNATDTKIQQAISLAGCDKFINQLDKGWHTLAGDAGGRLSGGEKQRIAIARALLKNAPIILLDEATASIDVENEYQIQQSINKLTQNKSVIIVAHRLSTIVNADNIVLVNNGQIHAQGQHETLLKNSRLYQKMWETHVNAAQWSIGKGGPNA